MKFLRNYIIEPFFIHFHYNKKDEKREKKHFFLFIHQNDLFAKYRIDRPSVITGAWRPKNIPSAFSWYDA